MSVKLTNTTPGHFKFWQAQVVGRTVICTWGRINSWVQSKTFKFESQSLALTFVQRKAESKLSNGYRLAA